MLAMRYVSEDEVTLSDFYAMEHGKWMQAVEVKCIGVQWALSMWIALDEIGMLLFGKVAPKVQFDPTPIAEMQRCGTC